MTHLSKKLPYEASKIAPEMTKAEIDGMLHEFVILDEHGKRVCEVTGIRWTELPPELPMLEFQVSYIDSGVKKLVAIRIRPPMIMTRKRKTGYGMVNTPAPSQSMRLLYWYLKSKLEAILFGLKDVTDEFLDSVLVSLPSGKTETVGDLIIEQIKESRIPMLGQKSEGKIIEVE